MKTTTVLLLLGGACVSLVAETNTLTSHKPVGRRVEQDITKWDVNQNGRLDREEMEAFRRDRIRDHQAQLDARAQAAVQTRKFGEAARRTRLVPPTLLKQYDANTNGLMDLEEWTVYRQDLARRAAEKRAARLAALAAATNGVAPVRVVSTNAP